MITYIKRSLLILLSIAGLAAQASALKISSFGAWKVNVLEKKNFFLGNAEVALTLPQGAKSFSPTVLVEKLPVAAIPTSTKEWHSLIFLDAAPKLSVVRERAYQFGNEIRYYVEFQSDIGTETPLHTALLATSLNGEIYIFAFQNHRNTFQNHVSAVRSLFRNIHLELIKEKKGV